ncbi:hypothetical protein quinque_000924 [Culex quinquefasciatus]
MVLPLKCLALYPPVSDVKHLRQVGLQLLNLAVIVASIVLNGYLLVSFSLESEVIKLCTGSILLQRMLDVYCVFRYVMISVVPIFAWYNLARTQRLLTTLEDVSREILDLGCQRAFGIAESSAFIRSAQLMSLVLPGFCYGTFHVYMEARGLVVYVQVMFRAVKNLYFCTYTQLWLQPTLFLLLIRARYVALGRAMSVIRKVTNYCYAIVVTTVDFAVANRMRKIFDMIHRVDCELRRVGRCFVNHQRHRTQIVLFISCYGACCCFVSLIYFYMLPKPLAVVLCTMRYEIGLVAMCNQICIIIWLGWTRFRKLNDVLSIGSFSMASTIYDSFRPMGIYLKFTGLVPLFWMSNLTTTQRVLNWISFGLNLVACVFVTFFMLDQLPSDANFVRNSLIRKVISYGFAIAVIVVGFTLADHTRRIFDMLHEVDCEV